MTNLTEQWKKGELINGKKYYITFFDSEPFDATFRYYEAMIPYWKFEANGKQYCNENGYDCVKVLAEVPSYGELQNMNKAVNECIAANIKLVEQITKLKGLLKKAKESMIYRAVRESSREMADKLHEEIKKINQVLGEN